ncbi:MAG: alpha/beta hydrolase fold domain-containing protein [Planctomycetota bacterium]|nr:alpha/beta hydrolase fold domain-containing protein [Planctomycetota bacterium]
MQRSIGKQVRLLVAVGLGLLMGVDFDLRHAVAQQGAGKTKDQKVLFEEDFAQGHSRWETTDAGSWELFHEDGNATFGLNKRISDYQPKVRSPHNIALIKGLSAGDVSITFRVRSTLDTGNHRDCCVFFGYQDPEHFYYVHLGAKPDPASGQIMIVNGEPRRALTENKNQVPWDDRWHTVKLERRMEAGLIQVYFDDMERPLMQATDKTFGVGRIGIGSFDDQNEFDDLRVALIDESPKAKAQDKSKKPPERPEPTVADYVYGSESSRQRLDFWKAESDRPTPVVLLIHGGGWKNGDKTGYGNNPIKRYLQEGISVAAINYRFIQQAMEQRVEPPVKAPLMDAARALQTLRSKAKEWNIDTNRIGATGSSAGACTSLWLALHDDLSDSSSSDPVARESTRLNCAAVVGAQTSLDPVQLRNWIGNSIYGGHAFGFSAEGRSREQEFALLLKNREKVLPWIREYSPIELISKDDPPLYLEYPNQKTKPELGGIEPDPTHSAMYGIEFRNACRALGVRCDLVFPGSKESEFGSSQEFLIEHLKR